MRKLKSSIILSLVALSGIMVGFSSWVSVANSAFLVDVKAGDVEELPFFETYGITFENLNNNLNYVIIDQINSSSVYFTDKYFSFEINFDFNRAHSIATMSFNDLTLNFNPIITFKNPSTGDSTRITTQAVNNEKIFNENLIYLKNLPNNTYDLSLNNLGQSSIPVKSGSSLSLYQLSVMDISYLNTNKSTVITKYEINLSSQTVYNLFSELILNGYTIINYSITMNLR